AKAHFRRTNFFSSQAIKHERIVRIRAVRADDFPGSNQCHRCGVDSSSVQHGQSRSTEVGTKTRREKLDKGGHPTGSRTWKVSVYGHLFCALRAVPENLQALMNPIVQNSPYNLFTCRGCGRPHAGPV